MSGEHVLYGYQGSGSAAVEAALLVAGLPHRLVNAASWDEQSALDELKRVNPLLQIPALVWPDGSVMSESAAILIELGLRHPASGLLPSGTHARATSIRGLVYIAANCYSAIGVIDYPARYCDPCDDTSIERIRHGTRARLHEMWERFADQFTLVPQRPGALELLAAVVSKWSGTRPHLKRVRPAFHEVLLHIESNPTVAPVFARHWPE